MSTSNDIDGKPILILTRADAEHVWEIMSSVLLNDAEAKVLDRIKTFLREAAAAPYSTELPRPGDVSRAGGVM